MDRSLAVTALLFTMLIWGVGPIFLRSASLLMGPQDALVIRYSMVSILYLTVLLATGGWRLAREDWPRLVFISLVGLLGYNLGSVFGFFWVPAGIGGLVIGTQPLLIALLAAVFAQERMTVFTILGVVLALAGTAALFWKDLYAPQENLELLLGSLLVFLSGVAWAFYVVLSRPLIRRYGALNVTAMSIIINALPIFLLASPQTWTTLTSLTTEGWVAMFYLVVLSTFLAAITWNYGAMRLEAATAGMFLYLVPLIAVAAGAIWFDEPITLEIVIGGTLILLGVAVAQAGPSILRLRV